jgi:MscS family membrane protein
MAARLAAFIVLWATLALPAFAQIPGLTKSASQDATPAEPVDALGRSTPRGTVVGFSQAMEREDLSGAAQYLQLTATQRKAAESLSEDLRTLIDSQLHENIGHMSDQPGGSPDDSLPADREHIGPMSIQGKNFYIELVRIRDPVNGQIWLISSDTLRDIPEMAGEVGKTWIERNLPKALLDHELLGLTLAHWVVLIGFLLATFAGLALFAIAANFIVGLIIRDPNRRGDWDAWYGATRWPAIAVLTIILQFLVIPSLGYPLTFRVAYAHVGLVAFVIALTWLIRRVLKLVFTHTRNLVRGRERASTQSLLLLAERMLQALIIVVAIVAVLILLGVESKTALAALGVVGVALALGAQKTVENLLGGIFLLSDKALAVGDYCTIGNQSGTVEDVTLRSVRIRTQQQTLVSLPAGSLAQAGIENFATRRKVMILTTLRLRYGTNVEGLRKILAGIRSLLDQNRNLENETAYIRLINFGAEAIELELFTYVLTADADAARVVREQLLLEVAALIEAAGSALTPTRYLKIETASETAPPA